MKIIASAQLMSGKSDGLNELYPLSEEQIRAALPGLIGRVELDNVGHWLQHEASAELSKQLVQFLRNVKPGVTPPSGPNEAKCQK